MSPRSKQSKNRAPNTDELVEKAKISGWERSKLSAQDHKLLKNMGLLKKEAMKMPGDESSPHPPIGFRVTFVDFLTRGLAVPVHEFLCGLLFIYVIQLHQLTPNSLLHISIFITLCECFLGIHPHWGLWKRIFFLRRNNSKNVIYNVGGVCICVRPDVDYFDVKFTDSVQGWRRKWLYIKDESSASQEYGLAPFDATEEIQRRKSWDAEATAEEKAATDALITRIHELQNTDRAELSDTESEQCSDSAHSVSPPPATSPDGRKRKRNDDEDSGASKLAEPAAEESSPDDQEAFDPFTMTGAVSSADEGEEEEEPEAHGPAPTSTSNTLVLSEERRAASEASPPPQHNSDAPTPVASPRAPKPKKAKTGAGSTHELATGSTSGPLLEDPLMKELVNLGSRFIGFRDEAATLREERADDLEAKLKASETACKKAEKDAAAVEDLCQRLQAAEDALSDKEAQQVERENNIVTRFETQSRRFLKSDDRLLDALDILELNCDSARKCISSARSPLKRVFPYFFPKDTQPEIFSQLAQHFLEKDDPALAYRQASLKIGVEGTIALVAASGQKVDWVKAGTPKGLNSEKWKVLVKDAKAFSKKLIAFLDPKSSASASTARTEVK
ncbi:hypothetical protein QYE76_019325 [Lolium multiflorum]|uniref:Transposase (putative) gypsy type domain-containing protein n=1 Tax=Lolium multiflorum TaxID=4521 RepID=A0AAD8R2W4_LOLMU|nr:hypothetical protein QYE76_019325 [Lolium multiflorum]